MNEKIQEKINKDFKKHEKNLRIYKNILESIKKFNFDEIKYFVNNYFELFNKSRWDFQYEIISFATDNFEAITSYVEENNELNKLLDVTPLINLCSDTEQKELQLEIVEYVLAKGIDANKSSPLMKVCSPNNHEINYELCNLLIKYGANVNYIDNRGKSILMEVCDGKYHAYKVAKLLIDNNVDINYEDNLGNNAINSINIFSIEKGDYENFNIIPESFKILDLLIENGANINLKNKMGFTPLMMYSLKGNFEFVKKLINANADINLKSEFTAYDLAINEDIKELIFSKVNHSPQKLVKLLTNFTIDKPIKYTTHTWDFGELKKEYISFDGYMNAVKTQFDSMKHELETLSPNLYKKIYTFLLETIPEENYSWCSKVDINIGWSSLNGLKEWCDSGKNPFDFKLQKPFSIPPRTQISTFGEVINLFKQEIEIRADFKNLETIFNLQKNRFDSDFKLDLQSSKLSRQFYTDTQKFIFALNKIFDEIRKRKEYQNIEVATLELDDRSIEIKIIQIDSQSSRSADELLQRSKQSGDLYDIVENLKNLCDYSCESSYENVNFRVNFLHSNNLKEKEILEDKPRGFTHILRFYK